MQISEVICRLVPGLGFVEKEFFFVENMVGDFGYTWGMSGRSYFCICCTCMYIFIYTYYVFKLCGHTNYLDIYLYIITYIYIEVSFTKL